MDRDNYFGTHISPKLYGNWILDEAWALKGGISSGYKNLRCGKTRINSLRRVAATRLIPICRWATAS